MTNNVKHAWSSFHVVIYKCNIDTLQEWELYCKNNRHTNDCTYTWTSWAMTRRNKRAAAQTETSSLSTERRMGKSQRNLRINCLTSWLDSWQTSQCVTSDLSHAFPRYLVFVNSIPMLAVDPDYSIQLVVRSACVIGYCSLIRLCNDRRHVLQSCGGIEMGWLD